jgi:hypothetical protein
MRRLILPLVACVLALTPVPPARVEQFYAAHWYPKLQPQLTGASNLTPFAWLDVVIVIAGAAVLAASVRAWRKTRGGRWRRAGCVAIRVLQSASVIYLAFLLLWGFNYRRTPAAERLQVSRDRLTSERLARLGVLATKRVNALYDPSRDEARLAGEPLIAALAPAFARAEAALGSGWHIRPGRPKSSLVGRMFPVSGVDGMVNPFGLEVILNPEVLPFERPFVLAHEWAHLAGHAPEDEASFVGLVACLQGTREAQYSGWLDLWLHVLRNLPAPARRGLLQALHDGPRQDLRAIDVRLRRVKPAVSAVSWSVYDQYLRANRVDSGLANYDEMVSLVLGSRFMAPVIDE